MQNYRQSPHKNGSVSNHGRHPAGKNPSPHFIPVKDSPISVKYERIAPIKPGVRPAGQISSEKKRQATERKRNHTVLRDFLFGFAVGLAVFGIAAIIVCNALLKLI